MRRHRGDALLLRYAVGRVAAHPAALAAAVAAATAFAGAMAAVGAAAAAMLAGLAAAYGRGAGGAAVPLALVLGGATAWAFVVVRALVRTHVLARVVRGERALGAPRAPPGVFALVGEVVAHAPRTALVAPLEALRAALGAAWPHALVRRTGALRDVLPSGATTWVFRVAYGRRFARAGDMAVSAVHAPAHARAPALPCTLVPAAAVHAGALIAGALACAGAAATHALVPGAAPGLTDTACAQALCCAYVQFLLLGEVLQAAFSAHAVAATVNPAQYAKDHPALFRRLYRTLRGVPPFG
jgi:hypothetical protein